MFTMLLLVLVTFLLLLSLIGKDKMDKTFAFAHMKIMREDGAIIPDGTHELFVYKVILLVSL